VNLSHGTVGDQTDQGVGRQQTERHDDGILEGLQAILLLTCVDNEDEDWGHGSGSGQSVLDGGAGRVQLWGDGVLGNVLVVRWQAVTLQTEGADPYPCAHVDLAEGVQDGATGLLARNGLILKQRRVGLLLEWCVESSDGDNESRGFHARRGKGVPTQSDTVLVLDIAPLLF